MELPCDMDGKCMMCKVIPADDSVVLCSSCSSPWHMSCLNPPLSEVPAGDWHCPDCRPADPSTPNQAPKATLQGSARPETDLVAKIRAIQADSDLSEAEKATQRQHLLAGASSVPANSKLTSENVRGTSQKDGPGRSSGSVSFLDDKLNCIFCIQLVDRPVTTPCGHNFCLKCFQKWVGQGKRTCGKCRAAIPPKMASQPRINAALVVAVRLAKVSVSGHGRPDMAKHYNPIANKDRPEKAFVTERAVKTGKANACSGRIFVTIPPDHFGPITAEYDPDRNQGVRVGRSWEDRMECRQWGAHFPHVAGIAGQADHGAQSVALSGGYEDDEDHGEWFLYTGSGGRDLSGNKRTNKEHSSDQKFESANEALRMSCKKGYPVRVVRSHKEKRSSYAPEEGVRYDGIYRIEKCWRKKGAGGYLVCRYLFVRCDNEPAPWTSDEQGDRPRPFPIVEELKNARDVTERSLPPSWDYNPEEEKWTWTREPPQSKKLSSGRPSSVASKRKQLSVQQRLLKEFGCGLCKNAMTAPLSTPCGHNYCKACLVNAYAGVGEVRERGRSLRAQKLKKPCPYPRCGTDLAEFLLKAEVNREMVDIIEALKKNAEENKKETEDTAEEQMKESKDSGILTDDSQELEGKDNALVTDEPESRKGTPEVVEKRNGVKKRKAAMRQQQKAGMDAGNNSQNPVII
eukprot:jgi/Mesen1/7316/ME000376S06491